MKKQLERRIYALKAIAAKQLKAGQLEHTLNTVATCALTLYTSNQYHMDAELEQMLESVAAQLPMGDEICPDEESVLFYDGLGKPNRGLLGIYLDALCSAKRVTFVTRREWLPELSTLCEKVQGHGGIVRILEGRQKTEDIRALQGILKECQAKHLFMYANADDTVVTTMFHTVPSQCIRYQINLTDHAFWLGSRCVDKCIEFRDYGGAISDALREIPRSKLVKLPFYPQIAQIPFEGYPDAFDPNSQKLIFSGGALYKTMSADNAYYRMVDAILTGQPNVIFWYAGFGDSSRLDELRSKHPGRVWHTAERRDLFQVLQHCDLYLSTYPVCGGLMFQYAAVAGKIPVTLRHDDICDGFLIDQERLGIEFATVEQTVEEVKTLLNQDDYRADKESTLSRAVMTPEGFREQLAKLMETGKTDYELRFVLPRVESLQAIYAENYTWKTMCLDLIRKGNLFLWRYFPVDYTVGFAHKMWKKVIRKP